MSAAAAAGDPIPPTTTTFWCHECDMSVSLPSLSPPSPLLCPHCHSDFLEQMDPIPPPPPQSLTLTDPSSDSNSDEDDEANPLHSPHAYLHRLIAHLADSDDPPVPRPRGPSPAARSSIAALPTVQISDPALLCAVCKDDLPLASSATLLPCSHLFHSDCIVPWLSLHNSCPLCRSPLPTPSDELNRRPRSRETPIWVRFGNLIDEAEGEGEGEGGMDRHGLRSTLRNIARRRRMVFPVRGGLERAREGPVEVSPTQMGEAGEGSGFGPANSGETVSSEWTRGGVGRRGVDDDGDTVMSEIRDNSAE